MFARILTVNLKPGQGPTFAFVIDEQILGTLRKFSGFHDEIAMVSPDGKQAVGISLWDSAEDAEAYNREGYASVLKAMEPVMDGKPVVKTYDVTTSTAHHVQTRKAGA